MGEQVLENNQMAMPIPSANTSTTIEGSSTIVPEQSEEHTLQSREDEQRQMQAWLVAQKGALGRIDALQEQIGAYRQKLVNNQKEHEQALAAEEMKLDLSGLNQHPVIEHVD